MGACACAHKHTHVRARTHTPGAPKALQAHRIVVPIPFCLSVRPFARARAHTHTRPNAHGHTVVFVHRCVCRCAGGYVVDDGSPHAFWQRGPSRTPIHQQYVSTTVEDVARPPYVAAGACGRRAVPRRRGCGGAACRGRAVRVRGRGRRRGRPRPDSRRRRWGGGGDGRMGGRRCTGPSGPATRSSSRCATTRPARIQTPALRPSRRLQHASGPATRSSSGCARGPGRREAGSGRLGGEAPPLPPPPPPPPRSLSRAPADGCFTGPRSSRNTRGRGAPSAACGAGSPPG